MKKIWCLALFLVGMVLALDAKADFPATIYSYGNLLTYEAGQSPCDVVNYGSTPWTGDLGVTEVKYCFPTDPGSNYYGYGWSISSTEYPYWQGLSFPCGYTSCRTGSLAWDVGAFWLICPENATLIGSIPACRCNTGYVDRPLTGKSCTPVVEVNLSQTPQVCHAKSAQGNPIYALTGAKREFINTGFSIGEIDLSLTYDTTTKLPASQAFAPTVMVEPNAFGALWKSSLHRRLQVSPGLKSALLTRGNGEIINFSGNGSGIFTGDVGNPHRLVSFSGGYRVTDIASGDQESFDSTGQLITITNVRGLVLSFSYSGGNLVKVQAGDGRTIRFRYTGNLITQITGPDGSIITPAYDANGNLVSLTWPSGTAHGFLYENTSLPWALTGKTDENGSRYATFAYDAQGRAVSTEYAGAVNQFSVSYAGPPVRVVAENYDSVNDVLYRIHSWQLPLGTTVTQPNGQAAGVGAANVLGMPSVASQSQPSGSGCAASTSAQSYDANGNIASRDDFQGARTCYVYDGANRETVRVEGLANTVDCSAVTPLGATLPTGARKITTAWHPDWNRPTQVNQPLLTTSTVYHGQPDPFNNSAIASCTTAANLPNGKPMPLVCKQVEQGVSSPDDVPGAQSDSSFGSVALLLHGDGPNGSTTFTDSSVFSRLVTASGTAKISTAQFKYGGSSVYFDGSASCLSSAATNNWSLGSGDFTVELWYSPSALKSTRLVTSRLTQGGAAGTWGFNVGATGISFTEVVVGEPGVSASFSFSTGVWYHLAASRSSGILRLFVNGVQVASAANTTNFSNTSYPLNIGCSPSENYVQGYIDDLRITKGVARYTGTFTPPAQPYPSVVGPTRTTGYTYDTAGRVLTATDTLNRTTSYSYYGDTAFPGNPPGSYDPDYDLVTFLLHGNGADGSTAIVDDSVGHKPITLAGNAKISTAQSAFGGSSIAFDGAGDYLTAPYSTDFAFGSGDFTIETFLYKNANNVNGSRIWSPNGDYYDGVVAFIDSSGNFGVNMSTTGNSWNFAFPVVANLANGQWYHLAITRSGGSVFAFVNGVKYTLTTQMGTFALYSRTGHPRSIGGQLFVDRSLNGYVDEFRITKGKARYTANFTPATQEFHDLILSPTDVGHTIGDLQSITNAAGHVTQFTQYDRVGRVRQMVDPKGVVTDISYTPRGWVSTVTTTAPGAAPRVTSYSYDNVGQLTGVTQPDGSTLSYSYDAAHRLIGVTDAKGNSVNYTLDNVGNRIAEEIKDPTGVLRRSISRSFDALNRLQQVTGAPR